MYIEALRGLRMDERLQTAGTGEGCRVCGGRPDSLLPVWGLGPEVSDVLLVPVCGLCFGALWVRELTYSVSVRDSRGKWQTHAVISVAWLDCAAMLAAAVRVLHV